VPNIPVTGLAHHYNRQSCKLQCLAIGMAIVCSPCLSINLYRRSDYVWLIMFPGALPIHFFRHLL